MRRGVLRAGGGLFTRGVGISCSKAETSFGVRSWRVWPGVSLFLSFGMPVLVAGGG